MSLYKISFISLLLICFFTKLCAHPESGKSLDKINKAVKHGENVAYASWWGFNPEDSTSALQAAIDSGIKKIIVPNLSKPWIVRPIKLRSDLVLEFESGTVVEAKKGEFKGLNDNLFLADRCKNIVIRGAKNVVLKMHREDYVKAPYAAGEWRMGIALWGCKNVLIENLRIENSGGDGIYLADANGVSACKNITIRNVESLNHHRQGISIISAENVLIENCNLSNTKGTNPQAGIDFEPNFWFNVMKNIVLRNVTANNNAGPGVVGYLTPLSDKSQPFSISLENCTANGNSISGFLFAFPPASIHGKSSLKLINCHAKDNAHEELRIDNKLENGSTLSIIGGSFIKTNSNRYPVVFSSGQNNTTDVGGASFKDTIISGKVPVIFETKNRNVKIKNISGVVCTTQGEKIFLNKYKIPNLHGTDQTPHLKFTGNYTPLKTKLIPDLPSFPQLEGVYSRGLGDYALYASKGEKVLLEIDYQQVGDYPGMDFKGTIIAPDKSKTNIPVMPFKARTPYSFIAKQTGVYRIRFSVWNNKVKLLRRNGGVALIQDTATMPLIGPYGRLYIYIPRGNTRFSIRMIPEGEENAAATLYDSKGKVFKKVDFMKKSTNFIVKRRADSPAEIWTLDIMPPKQGRFEDFAIELNGIPPLFAFTPDGLLKE